MSRPNLVLLHGWGVNRCVWQPLVDDLQQEYTVYAPDLLGYGQRESVPPRYDLASLAHEISTVVPDHAVILGWSLGGLVALQLALTQPERLAKLVLVGTTPRFACGPDWEHGVEAAVVQRFAADLARDYDRALMRFLLLQAGRLTHARSLARGLSAHIASCGRPAPQVLELGLRLLLSTDMRNSLHRVHTPVHIIHGALDRLIPPGAAKYLATHLPTARLTMLPLAGHAPFVAQADTFAALLRQATHA